MNSRPAHPIVPGSVPLSGPGASQTVGVSAPSPLADAPASPIGARRSSSVATDRPTGEAGAPNLSTLPKVTCNECGGSGEALFLALDGIRYEVGYCDPCDGTGLVDPTCHRCDGPLTATGWCADCQENLFLDFTVTVARDGTAYLQEKAA